MKFPNYIVFLYGKQRILHKSRIYGLLASLDMEKILYFLGVAEEKYNLILLCIKNFAVQPYPHLTI